MFETACEVKRGEISDDQALAALCAELRADFAADARDIVHAGGVHRLAALGPIEAASVACFGLLLPSRAYLVAHRAALLSSVLYERRHRAVFCLLAEVRG